MVKIRNKRTEHIHLQSHWMIYRMSAQASQHTTLAPFHHQPFIQKRATFSNLKSIHFNYKGRRRSSISIPQVFLCVTVTLPNIH
jgi:hypothetical protein